jgi:hypothetical protein
MRTEWLCETRRTTGFLFERTVYEYRDYSGPIHHKNIGRYDLVPQKHGGDNQWYKIVIMDHVEVDHLSTFIADLKDHPCKKELRSKYKALRSQLSETI